MVLPIQSPRYNFILYHTVCDISNGCPHIVLVITPTFGGYFLVALDYGPSSPCIYRERRSVAHRWSASRCNASVTESALKSGVGKDPSKKRENILAGER